MSDDRARLTNVDHDDIERRIRALERQSLEARPSTFVPAQTPAPPRRTAARRAEEASAGTLLSLLLGLALMAGGLVLFLSRVVVWSGFLFMGSQPPLALLLIPFIIGVGLTLAGGRVARYLGLVITVLSIAGLFGASLNILRLYFLPTPLLTVLGMLALLGLGLGLVVRAVRRL